MTEERLIPASDMEMPTIYRHFIQTGRFKEGIKFLEQCMAAVTPATDFHAIVGKSLMGQLDEAYNWLTKFYDKTSAEFKATIIYIEMNRFDFNTDKWYMEAFAFKTPLSEALDDLGMFETMSDEFVFRGMEDIQVAMQAVRDMEHEEVEEILGADEDVNNIPQHLRDADGIAFMLVHLHVQRLAASVYDQAKRNGHPVGDIPLIATVHDSDAYYTTHEGVLPTY